MSKIKKQNISFFNCFKGVNLAEMNKEERKQFFERESRRDSHQSVRRSSSSGSGRERRISQSGKLK